MDKCKMNFSFRRCFLMWLIFELSTGVLASITEGPKNSLLKVGGNVEFKCITDKEDCSNIEWSKLEGVQSPFPVFRSSSGMLNPGRYPEARYSVSSVGHCNLNISNLNLNDSGVFTCSETRDQTEKTASAVLVVYERSLCNSNASDDIKENSVYGISCSVKIKPLFIKPSTVKLSWNDTNLTSASSNEASDTVMLTHTGEAKPSDVPGFQCNVSLSVNQQSASFDLRPLSSEVFSFQTRKVSCSVRNIRFKNNVTSIQKGQKVECVADCYPSYEWKSKTGDVTTGPFLTISESSKDGDIYVCTAKNLIDGVTYSVSQNILVEVPSPPPIGLIVGIVVGLVVLCCCVVVFILFKRYKKKQSADVNGEKAAIPLTAGAPSKPPRANSNQGIN